MVGKRLSATAVGVVMLSLPGCDSSQPQQAEEVAAKLNGKTVAKWEREMRYDLGINKSTLVYRDGKTFRQWEDTVSNKDGASNVRLDEVIERPAENPNERRFDFDEEKQSEYFTLSAAGIVKYFSWEGRQFANLQTTFIDPGAMTIGSNVQVRECTPRQLSAAAAQAVRLYKELLTFKDDPEFGELGFSGADPYTSWLARIQALSNREDEAKVYLELNFFVGDVLMLGMEHVGDFRDRQYIEELERKIKAGLGLAFCE